MHGGGIWELGQILCFDRFERSKACEPNASSSKWAVHAITCRRKVLLFVEGVYVPVRQRKEIRAQKPPKHTSLGSMRPTALLHTSNNDSFFNSS